MPSGFMKYYGLRLLRRIHLLQGGRNLVTLCGHIQRVGRAMPMTMAWASPDADVAHALRSPMPMSMSLAALTMSKQSVCVGKAGKSLSFGRGHDVA